jgi:hypothetical protein
MACELTGKKTGILRKERVGTTNIIAAAQDAKIGEDSPKRVCQIGL